MDDISAREKADLLLVDWYVWSMSYRPALGVPGCDPACRQSTSSRQWDTTLEITREVADQLEIEAVQACYDALDLPYQVAIGIEMRNRMSRAAVWRSPYPQTYAQALDEIVPKMRARHLL